MATFLSELKRRHIYRVAAAYAVVAWVLLQLFNNLEPILKLPQWAGTLVLVLLLGGLPVALLLAWVRELAPADGSTARAATEKLDWALIGALVVVIGIFVYQQVASSSGTRTAQQASVANASAQPQIGGISIAVLPFANVSGDAGQEFFSDGMTDEIILALAKVPDLRIVARTSAFEFKGQNRNIRAIGLALGASHLIEGSVRKMGDRVRITAQLVQAENGLQLWSDAYDRQLTDIFAAQEDIAQAIAGALKVPLGLAQGDTLVRDRTKDLETYDQYLRARALFRDRHIDEAVSALEKLVARDPSFAPAWATLSNAYRRSQGFDSPAMRSGPVQEARRLLETAVAKAEMAARRAIQLDPKSASGYGALAALQRNRGRWLEAEDLFKQALALDANEPDVLDGYGLLLATVGRLREALSVTEKLRTLEPLVFAYDIGTAGIMQFNRQYAASITILEAIPPDPAINLYRNSVLAHAYAGVGRYADAADALLAIEGNIVSRRSVEDAARLLRQAPTKAGAQDALPALEAPLNFVYAYVGATERMLDSLERRFEIRGTGAAGAEVSIWTPELSPLRKTERFKAVLRKAGLVDYWRARGWPDLCRPVGTGDFVCD